MKIELDRNEIEEAIVEHLNTKGISTLGCTVKITLGRMTADVIIEKNPDVVIPQEIIKSEPFEE